MLRARDHRSPGSPRQPFVVGMSPHLNPRVTLLWPSLPSASRPAWLDVSILCDRKNLFKLHGRNLFSQYTTRSLSVSLPTVPQDFESNFEGVMFGLCDHPPSSGLISRLSRPNADCIVLSYPGSIDHFPLAWFYVRCNYLRQVVITSS